ncbi:hypothetical protein PPERSA_03299 [Pseudocohnilembus persalinus]|uniref:C2H2-type domain-containing protein n=1 Tax=Pseudocohnilembus persalinus TaxID=266149 RepID=A0A0V0Q8V9_PSEPJ|nr:hypothetical protein PPERSA_03299 [Pseudocohnilembus persalinus]|eukprot:KRW98468.1 hypothetical protein PPERSA_03299 [Pseudocohnilembus persalinus]
MIATVQPTPKQLKNNLLDSETSSNNQSTHAYHCSHCAQNFTTEEDYKFHYKSDLHKYNLKRRILDLNPVSEEQFNLWFNKDQSETSVYSNMLYCIPCGKQFSQKKTLNQHLQSKKHQEKMTLKNQNWREVQHLKDSESDTSASKIIDKRLSNEDPTVCLFCDQRSSSVNINKNHMEKRHGFFVLQEQFLKNLRGLIQEYGKLINEQLTCIVCEATFKSAEGVKKHMIDKQHCHMKNLTSDNEFLIFYDFLKNPNIIELSEEEEEEEEKNNIILKPNLKKSETHNFEENEKHEQKDGDKKQEKQEENLLEKSSEWEIYHAEHDIEKEDNDNKLTEEERSELENKKKAEFIQFLDKIQQKVTLQPTGEIQLQNGKTLGHRQYKKYYHMYYRDFQEYMKKSNQKMIENVGVDKFKLRSNNINLAIKAEAHNVEIEDEANTHQLTYKSDKKTIKQMRLQQKSYDVSVKTCSQVKAQQRKNQRI